MILLQAIAFMLVFMTQSHVAVAYCPGNVVSVLVDDHIKSIKQNFLTSPVLTEHLKNGLVRHKKGPSEAVSFRATIQLRKLIKVRALRQKFIAPKHGTEVL